MNKRKIFNDPVHGFITIPHELVFDIIEHKYFQRLRRIKQLGLTDYVYPGAIHSRFHHALGAFHLMRRVLSLLKIKGHRITDEEELGASIAILLHDIGHGPFSHTLEKWLIPKVHHEDISRIYMQRLNRHFKGRLELAIQIFDNTYRKKFLHQLVSSQLDVDRLDYLTRDSFFTGVSEGAIPYERIIEMINVHDDELVVEEKGVYSVESFIISRRLMFWQVYLHKTVLCVEEMMVKAVQRARQLALRHEEQDVSPALNYFLKHKVLLKDFSGEGPALDYYSELDDVDVLAALKKWQLSGDKVLHILCDAILNRRLFRTESAPRPFAERKIRLLREKAMKKYRLNEEEAAFIVFTGSTSNHAYDPAENRINILTQQDKVIDIARASQQLNSAVLSKPVTRHYVFYPKGLENG